MAPRPLGKRYVPIWEVTFTGWVGNPHNFIAQLDSITSQHQFKEQRAKPPTLHQMQSTGPVRSAPQDLLSKPPWGHWHACLSNHLDHMLLCPSDQSTTAMYKMYG
mmetsp:Transcript_22787/g.43565  ORF Transcript_22787/g.43565 Transcript_22787/m.43565 type:complete len:105 (-) Transcript_22787:397-711(-)